MSDDQRVTRISARRDINHEFTEASIELAKAKAGLLRRINTLLSLTTLAILAFVVGYAVDALIDAIV